jgi:hypothetical protein
MATRLPAVSNTRFTFANVAPFFTDRYSVFVTHPGVSAAAGATATATALTTSTARPTRTFFTSTFLSSGFPRHGSGQGSLIRSGIGSTGHPSSPKPLQVQLSAAPADSFHGPVD